VSAIAKGVAVIGPHLGAQVGPCASRFRCRDALGDAILPGAMKAGPLGSEAFLRDMEGASGRVLLPQKRGPKLREAVEKWTQTAIR
jgi:hypothetical protein